MIFSQLKVKIVTNVWLVISLWLLSSGLLPLGNPMLLYILPENLTERLYLRILVYSIGVWISARQSQRQERMQVPHHLIDVADPDETWSLAMFQNAARKAIQEIHRRGHLPILVGGTGQYIHAIIEDWELPIVEPNPKLRTVLENRASEITPEKLHHRLKVLDPAAASRMDQRNTRRIVRALEVIFSTGYRFSDQRKKKRSPYHILKLGLMQRIFPISRT